MPSFATQDTRDGLKLFRYWIYAAFVKLQLEHQKTKLSLLWGPISVLFVAATLAFVWSSILGVESALDYFFYILIGFSLWNLLLSKLVNRAVSSLSRRSNELVSTVRPISTLALEDISYSFLNYFTTAPLVLIACCFVYDVTLNLVMLFFIGLILIWFTAFGLCMTLGVLAFFYRDVLQVVKSVMRLGFLVTPIIWKPERLGEYQHMVWWNPFYSFIDICRSPLMGQNPDPRSWSIAISMAVILSIFGWICLALTGTSIRRRLFSQ